MRRRSLIAALVIGAVVVVGGVRRLAAPGGREGEPAAGAHEERERLEVRERNRAIARAAGVAGADDPSGRAGAGPCAVAHHAGARPVQDAPAPPCPRLFRTRVQSYETTLNIARDGTMFFPSIGGGVAPPAVVRSSDGGATWKDVSPRDAAGSPTHVSTEDPYTYVDPDTSRVFTDDLVEPCHVISFSDDLGKSWTDTPPAGCGYNSDHQTLFGGPAPAGAARPAGYPNVLYLCTIAAAASVASTLTTCSKSLDGGTSFQPTGRPAYVADGQAAGDFNAPGACQGTTGHGSVGPDGTLYLPKGLCARPYLAISRDEGDTWTRVQVADNGMACCYDVGTGDRERNGFFDHEAGVAADRAGNVFYAWVARNRLPYLAVSHDHGKTWGKPMMIAPPGVRETVLPELAMGDDGRIAVAYMGSTNSPWDSAKATGSGADYTQAAWHAYLTITPDARQTDPIFYSAAVNDPADPLVRGICGPVQCQLQGEFIGVSVAPDGTAWTSATDTCAAGATDCTADEAVVGQLVGGPPLRGSVADQTPAVTLPSGSVPRACASRRRFAIRLRQPRRGRIRRATVFVDGRRVRVLSGRRLRAMVDLRGLPKGRFAVRVVVTTSSGRNLVQRRSYSTCGPQRSRS